METSVDAFLGGRLSIRQPVTGYRAGIDPVCLAAATLARPGERVLELGCGVGVAALCLAARVADIAVTGVEVQPAYAALARENAAANALALTVVEADIAALPGDLRAQSFDHVIANPPYFPPEAGTPATDAGKARANAGAGLADWIDTGLTRLRPKGRLTMIQRMERVPDMLRALGPRAGDIWLRPLTARAGRAPERVLLTARKGTRGVFRMAPPLVLHAGARHAQDGEDYAPEMRAVLREGAALPWAL